jgi:hypothetical protein
MEFRIKEKNTIASLEFKLADDNADELILSKDFLEKGLNIFTRDNKGMVR